jgi:hypothetical protein
MNDPDCMVWCFGVMTRMGLGRGQVPWMVIRTRFARVFGPEWFKFVTVGLMGAAAAAGRASSSGPQRSRLRARVTRILLSAQALQVTRGEATRKPGQAVPLSSGPENA